MEMGKGRIQIHITARQATVIKDLRKRGAKERGKWGGGEGGGDAYWQHRDEEGQDPVPVPSQEAGGSHGQQGEGAVHEGAHELQGGASQVVVPRLAPVVQVAVHLALDPGQPAAAQE